jgi:hypothetical protein
MTEHRDAELIRALAVVDTDRGESPFGWSADPTPPRHITRTEIDTARTWSALCCRAANGSVHALVQLLAHDVRAYTHLAAPTPEADR